MGLAIWEKYVGRKKCRRGGRAAPRPPPPGGPLPSESGLGLPPQPSLSSFSSNHFHISPAVIIKYSVSDLTFTEAAATGNSGTVYFFVRGCELGAFSGFQCHCSKKREEKKEERKEKSGREGQGAARGSPARRRAEGV